jgi:very-short-patch-repair endonuclease
MTNIIKFDGFDSNEIRTTEDGRFSVYDVIKFCGKKNPHDAWKSLCEQFPEVLTQCEYFKFSGRGQRKTPVADRQAIELILQYIGCHPDQFAVTSNKFFPRTETQVVSVLASAFADCNPITQFTVHGYRIDLYLASANIAVEVDENGHAHYDSKEEIKRAKVIKSALGCSFVRLDPYAFDFNLGDVILKIRNLIGEGR